MKIKTPEKSVMQAVSQYLTVLERMGKVAWWTRVNSGMMRWGNNRMMHLSRTGTPDFVGVLSDGRFFGLEAKGSEGTASPAQLETLLKIKRTGAVGMLVYSVDDVERAFAE